MSKYGQFCPVARSLEILGDRWTLLILREMLGGATHFNELERGLPGISRPLLAQRLRRLQHAQVIDKRGGGTATEYVLTQAGVELQGVIGALTVWGEAWAFTEPKPDELDPVLLMWWLRGDVRRDRLPKERTVVQYDLHTRRRRGTFWLVMTSADVSLCLTDPGYEIDLLVTADVTTMYKLWWGLISYDQARDECGVTVDGIPAMVRRYPDLFTWGAAQGMNYVKANREMRARGQVVAMENPFQPRV
ncbi:winged helix-turn-helix transcriptional regulator [Gordonia sp. NPDC003424]